MLTKVTPVTGISIVLENYYPHTMEMHKKLKKQKKNEQAARVLAYANRMQKLVYCANTSTNTSLINSYTKECKELYLVANEFYAEA